MAPPTKPQPPRPGSSSQLPKVVVEESASPPQGEPRAVPHRDRLPSVPDGASARVQGDDPVAVLRAELAERDAQVGKLLASMGLLQEQVLALQTSIPPPAPDEDEAPTPTAWKTAVFKLVVGMAAAAGAAATLFQIVSATLEPKIKKLEDDKGTEQRSDYYTELQRYEYDLKVKNLSECRWKHSAKGFKMLLPSPDKMGSALKMETFVGDDVCPDWPAMPDKPQAPKPPPKKD